ncbi:hypothetical protein CVT24_008696 [Panaeolus cyanescens]|uniref:Cytochrome P450 n=1 Tax=Panaeolus cyanescens TaxID=181874 RepID=A0A409VKM8_9AGAR|nr:hypothetical protein CVT24_008696 [Panaeolus cyanescens]
MKESNVAVFLLSILLCVLIYLRLQRKRSHQHLPPGPPKLPILGNFLDIPTSFEWEVYAKWGQQYSEQYASPNSDIIHFQAAGFNFMVLNSYSAASDLCDKRSSIYSSRPRLPMLSELMGWGWLISAMVYGDPWRERRRLFTKFFNQHNSDFYRPRQAEFVRKMLVNLLDRPDEFLDVVRETIGGIALSLAYGLQIKPSNDPYIQLAEEASASFLEAAVPGAFLVDVFPIFQYIPGWVPGAKFQSKAKAWRKLQEDFHERPFAATIQSMASGESRPSLTSNSLAQLDESSDVQHQHEVIKDTAGIVFAGGADTSLAAIHTFFLAMLCYPAVQARAQEELDRVLGGRLPEYSDEADLPYISALVKEVLRWQPATPIAVPHMLTEDDVYKGYFIPKGSVIIGNSWAMLQNERDYPEPSVFKPERFLKNGKLNPYVRDPALMAFGFGRRYVVFPEMLTVFSQAPSVLSMFTITEAIDGNGFPIPPVPKYRSGMIFAQYNATFVLAAISLATWVIAVQLKKARRLPLPPGPKRLPLLGHLLTIPRSHQWTAYHQISKDLDSDIICFEVMGNTIVVLNSNQAVADVLEKKSLTTSDRPAFPMLRELMGWDWALPFKDYTEAWKNHRKLFRQQLGPSAVVKYQHYQIRASRRLLNSFLNKTKDIVGDLKLLSGEVVITIAYGREVTNTEHPYVLLANDAIHPLLEFSLKPDAFLVNTFPILKYVPEWFPGAGFQTKARIWREYGQKFINVPFNNVKEDLKNGTAKVSFVSESLQNIDKGGDIEMQERDIKHVAAAMFAGGADTTMSVVSNAMLTLLQHPHVVKKAQEELDRVIGRGNLPDFTDQESLPYITAVVKECLRWREPSPLALPHVATVEETYKGYRIPKGAYILGNIWACMHDENYFDNPEVFNPERYLSPDGKLDPNAPDPETTIWGFGRRVCPGRYIGMNSIWLGIASILAAFHINRVDETAGPDHPYLYDFLRVPQPFNLSFEPRSKEVEKLIRDSMHD